MSAGGTRRRHRADAPIHLSSVFGVLLQRRELLLADAHRFPSERRLHRTSPSNKLPNCNRTIWFAIGSPCPPLDGAACLGSLRLSGPRLGTHSSRHDIS